jgi:hypothetical protein
MYKAIAIICCLSALVAGCGGNQPTTLEEADTFRLSQVGELCRHNQFSKNKPPQRVDERMSLLQLKKEVVPPSHHFHATSRLVTDVCPRIVASRVLTSVRPRKRPACPPASNPFVELTRPGP